HALTAVLASLGGPRPNNVRLNGSYRLVAAGRPFHKAAPTGALKGAPDLGRTTFAYPAGGKRLYALVESTATVAFKGMYVSLSGNLAGPWKRLANTQTLTDAGSALAKSGGTPG